MQNEFSREMQNSLANIEPGHYAAVLQVQSCQAETARLMELGFMPGVFVEVLCGHGDILVKLGEQKICLRRETADLVQVTPI